MTDACRCYRKPACSRHLHDLAKPGFQCDPHEHADLGRDPSLTGPPCIWCNSPTRRAGVCWLCPMCGTTTAC